MRTKNKALRNTLLKSGREAVETVMMLYSIEPSLGIDGLKMPISRNNLEVRYGTGK